jgi:DNA-binding SARP family transcriptional activator
MAELRLTLFGTPTLKRSEQTIRLERRKAAALAAYLAVTEQRQSRDVLTALLWPESDYEQGRAALRSTLSALTTGVPVPWIEADRRTVGLKADAVWVDVRAFLALVEQIDAHHPASDALCESCANAAHEAVKLYRADFLHGFYLADSIEFEEWSTQQRDLLGREYADLQRRLALHHSDGARYDLALEHARQWLACDPLQESAHRQLMWLYAAHDQRTEALRQYKQCVDLLEAELASPPEAETTQLYDAIVQQQPMTALRRGGKGNQPSGVMPTLPALVIGRETALREIKRRLGMAEAPARLITVIHGWPGVGKSTTVAMITHDDEIARQFPDGILWTSLGETPDLLGALRSWADALGIEEAAQAARVEDLSLLITSRVRGQRLLLVIDDVWNLEHAKPFRVGGQHCATIMTSRLFDVAAALAPTSADVYRLPVLSEDASLALLAELTPETVREHPAEARLLVNDLEGLPLAIHVAGRLLHAEYHMGWGVKHLLEDLRSGAGLLQAHAPTDMLGVERSTSPTVAALLNRSTDMLSAEDRRCFALLGLFVPKPATFHLDAVAAAWDMADPRPIVRRLVSYGLLEPVSGGRFQMHALLVMHAQTLLNREFGS